MNCALWLLLIIVILSAALLPAVYYASKLEINCGPEKKPSKEDLVCECKDSGLGRIVSKPRVLEIREYKDVELPCETDGKEDIQLTWMKGKTILFTDSVRFSNDNRLERVENGYLKINNVTSSDAGNYTCEILEPSRPSLTHQLKVLSAPRITNWFYGEKKTLKEGETLTLSCSATGYPQPSISWSRQGHHNPNDKETFHNQETVTIRNINRKHNDIYECKATNNASGPAIKSVKVEVKYAPEIEIKKAFVNSDEGSDAELMCEVHADPTAEVSWSKDDATIAESAQYKASQAGTKHILTISNTQIVYFGNYTCHAINSIGESEGLVELSGKPTPARNISISSVKEHVDRLKLSWIVESQSSIYNFTLRYMSKTDREWKKVHPPVEIPKENIYRVEQFLKLTPGEYEAEIISENHYGQSGIRYMFNYNAYENFHVDVRSKGSSGAPSVKSHILTILTIVSLIIVSQMYK